jgi:hypothetical protein
MLELTDLNAIITSTLSLVRGWAEMNQDVLNLDLACPAKGRASRSGFPFDVCKS